MCLCVCDWECASVFRRCCFPQPWSNSVVTQSPCERFPASVLPPVDSLSLAGWVAECVWQRPAQSHWTPSLHIPHPSLRPAHPPIRIDLLCQPLGLSAAATFAAVPASCVHSILTSYTCHSTTASVEFAFVCVCVCCGGWVICVWDHAHAHQSNRVGVCKKVTLLHKYMRYGILCKTENMPPMLILNSLSDWGKCLPDNFHTTMLSYGPQLPACPPWFQHPGAILGREQTRPVTHSHCLTVIHPPSHSLLSCLCWHPFSFCFLDR